MNTWTRNTLMRDLVRSWAGSATTARHWTHDEVDTVWPALEAHRVEALLAPLLPAELLRPEQAAAVTASRERTRAMLMELERILPGITYPGCRPLVLKGAALAVADYPDPNSRWFVDLDLLVPRDQVEEVCARLTAFGYHPAPGQSSFRFYDRYHLHRILVGPAGAVVEVHWDLTLSNSAYRYDLAGVWDRARTAFCGSHECLVASAADQVVHGVYQQLVDGFVDLRRVLDFVTLMPNLSAADWALVRELADWGRMGRGLDLDLHVVKSVADLELPPIPPTSVPLDSCDQRLLAGLHVADGCLERRSSRDPGYNRFLHLILVPGAQLRLKEFMRLLVPGLETCDTGTHPLGTLPSLPRRLRSGARNMLNLLRIGRSLNTH